MRILLVHNRYGSEAPSGENVVVESERQLLQSRGHEVMEFARHSDSIRERRALGTVIGALATPWNPFAANALRRAVLEFRPDIVHVHNTFPLISPAAFHAIGRRAARVLTLHNYRLFCPAAIPMRGGRVCTECLDRHSVVPSLVHGCYRNSRIATAPLALSVALHRRIGTWRRQVEAFIALTDFQKDLMVRSGLPADKVFVKPNFFPGQPEATPWAERDPVVVYAGRLSPEKGVRTLVRAWRSWGKEAPELRIVGDGELRQELEQLAQGSNVRFLGLLGAQEAQRMVASSRLLVLPSECLEIFGLVVCEAFAHGTPAAVSAIGPLPSIVRQGENGVVFQPGQAESIANTIRAAWQEPGLLQRLGEGARKEYERNYNEDANYRDLIDIYCQATKHMLATCKD
ncbi:MAG: glycosyltransferase family 4 protein [Anaerolineae bacterium]|nr:glycosyltransferase family 4 protein [Anaerolineae bacterium]